MFYFNYIYLLPGLLGSFEVEDTVASEGADLGLRKLAPVLNGDDRKLLVGFRFLFFGTLRVPRKMKKK